MIKLTVRAIIYFPIILSLTLVHGRLVQSYTYAELVAASDLVAIIKPISNNPADDVYPGDLYNFSPSDFSATNTTFELLILLKGMHSEEAPLVIRHFNYSDSLDIIVNGARFLIFAIWPLEFKKQIRKDEQEIGETTVYQESPVWIAFLKKLDDGRYEGVTNLYDSADSFRELHRSSFYTK